MRKIVTYVIKIHKDAYRGFANLSDGKTVFLDRDFWGGLTAIRYQRIISKTRAEFFNGETQIID